MGMCFSTWGYYVYGSGGCALVSGSLRLSSKRGCRVIEESFEVEEGARGIAGEPWGIAGGEG